MADRVTFTGGNFFDRVPSDCDAYMMSHIIRDWNEDQCLTILRNCRRALKSTNPLVAAQNPEKPPSRRP
jgi:hypothetical protein